MYSKPQTLHHSRPPPRPQAAWHMLKPISQLPDAAKAHIQERVFDFLITVDDINPALNYGP